MSNDDGDAKEDGVYVPPRKRQPAEKKVKPPSVSTYAGVEAQYVRSTATIKQQHFKTAPTAMVVASNTLRAGSRPMSFSQMGGLPPPPTRQALPYENHCTFCQLIGEPEKIYKSHNLLRDDSRLNCKRYGKMGCLLCSKEMGAPQIHLEIHCNKYKNTRDPGFDEFFQSFNLDEWEANQKSKGGERRGIVQVPPSVHMAASRPPYVIVNSNLGGASFKRGGGGVGPQWRQN